MTATVEELLTALARAWNGRIAAFHNVVQSDLGEFAGQDGRAAASDFADGRHRDPRV